MAYTIENLKLNVKEACIGKPWLILPQEYRTKPLARSYPLPSKIEELQLLATIPLVSSSDCGGVYIRRAISELNKRLNRSRAASERADRKVDSVEQQALELKGEFEARLAQMESQAQDAVKRVEDTVGKAIASLDDLFSLGRKGIQGQMEAHLAGQEWKGEVITAGAFRQCFRMVSMAVKGLGLPSPERDKARDAVVAELAASLRATQEATAMSKEPEGPVS